VDFLSLGGFADFADFAVHRLYAGDGSQKSFCNKRIAESPGDGQASRVLDHMMGLWRG
jgi:hypothetical protein